MDCNYYEILTQIVIDNYKFTVTWSEASGQCCVLWIQDTDTMDQLEALGRFSRFEKRTILDFVVRYVTSHALREEISKRRFAFYVENLSQSYFEDIYRLDPEQKAEAFRNLFNLDSVIDEAADLGWKRRWMAKKFHPDRGGSKKAMSLINEGYDFLKEDPGKKDGKDKYS
ncbi:MAG: hypothetical protein ACOCR8_02530 [Desulfosalsimonas sp.]